MHAVPSLLDETYHGHSGRDQTVKLANRENLVLSLVAGTRMTGVLVRVDIFIGMQTRMLNLSFYFLFCSCWLVKAEGEIRRSEASDLSSNRDKFQT